MAQWLSEDRLKQFEPTILRQSDILVNTIMENELSQGGWTRPINISDHCKGTPKVYIENC